ncbi:MAG: YbaK/prolyl-tRNA synthetase associated region [candidate division WWE3 bacterium GW2011_GWA1_41_8]|uniref:YbaK/prolyl-tRNA synthetase associated region n=1 Tax=candidate division WWE3 bacterium GW2011_GWA1_41_8 TaxID=1619103 RepID=A0A0G0XCN5_UNCKA|nr:MAG: YbaK/prolyl-tRNA synthetase associated region [candidate division WWE3 bacterium GW2011_GWA1_41_8]
MTVFDNIISLLNEKGVKHTVIEHEPVYTSEQAARIRDTDISMGAKALICYADKSPVLLVVPGDKKADFKKYKQTFGVKDLRMATPTEALELTGLEAGSIKALGLPSYYDSSFGEKDYVSFNAGSHTSSVKMKASDLIGIEDPVLADIT